MANRHEDDAAILRIKTRDVFCLPSDILDADEWKQEKTRNYSLEQFLPVNAEDIASRVLGTNTQGLVLAVPIETVKKELLALEASGAWVAAIVPEFLLAIAALQADDGISNNCEILVQEEDETWSFGVLKNGNLVQWDWLAPKEALQRFNSPTDQPRYVVASQLGNRGPNAEETHFLQISLADLANTQTARILQQSKLPPIDFRGTQLASRNPFRELARGLRFAFFSLTLAALIASVQLYLSTQRLEQQTSVFQAQQQALFKETFPSSRIPTDVPSRLRSEVQKIENDNLAFVTLPKTNSVRPVLDRFLAALPSKGQYRIDSIIIQGRQIKQCKGLAISLDDQEQVSNALRDAGFQFTEPAIQPNSDKKYPFDFTSLVHSSATEAP